MYDFKIITETFIATKNITIIVNILFSLAVLMVSLQAVKLCTVYHSLNPPPFTKGGIDFLKFGSKGGDEIFFLEREGLD